MQAIPQAEFFLKADAAIVKYPPTANVYPAINSIVSIFGFAELID